MIGDELPPYADLVTPKGEPRTAYQAVAVAHDGSVTRGKLRLDLQDAKRDAIELGRPGRVVLADVRIEPVPLYDRGITAGASVAGDKRKDTTVATKAPTKKKMIKQKPAKRIATKAIARKPAKSAEPKPKRAAVPKASRNGHAPEAPTQGLLDLADLKPGSHIVATFKGKTHGATIITVGDKRVVLYRGLQYRTLSGAALAVIQTENGRDTKARANGRRFWKVA